MDQLLQNLKVATRSLLRHRAFSLAAVLTLALGIGAATAIFSVVYGVLLRPLPYPEADRLVTLGQTAKDDPAEPVGGSVSPVNFLDWQREAKTIDEMALVTGGRFVVTNLGDADVVDGGVVSPGFFGVMKSPPMMGRDFTNEENLPVGPRAIIVSHSFWQDRMGGRADVLQQSIEVSGIPRQIVGVAPPGFDYPNQARLWGPVRNDDTQCGRSCVFLDVIGRLADGATPQAAQQEMTGIAAALEQAFPNDNTNVTVMVQTLQDRTVGSVQLALMVLLGAVVLVLLIACANVANLVMVRGAARQSEMAVRMALGAGYRGVLSYLLAENVLLGLAGGVGGLLLAAWGIDALKLVAPANLPRLDEVRFDLPAFAFALAMVMLTTVLFGFGPSLTMARTPLAGALGSRGIVGGSVRRGQTPRNHPLGVRPRSLLLAGEVALSLVLLLGAGLLLRSLAAQQDTELGFEADGRIVFALSLPPANYPADRVVLAMDQLRDNFAALPGVERVARVSALPLGSAENVFNFMRPDQPPASPGLTPVARHQSADANYFSAMGIPVLAGRSFTAADRAGAPPVAIISKGMAEKFWPEVDPIGRLIRIGGEDSTIVGVVGDVRSLEVTQAPQPEMYQPLAQTGARSARFVLQGSGIAEQGSEAALLAGVRQVVREFDSRLPVIQPGTMAAIVDEHLARPRFYVLLLGLFSALAVVLAAVGIYGVVAYVVSQRTREIGVRMALGARQQEVVRLMLLQGLRPAAAGIVLGIIVSLALGRVASGLLYTVRPTDPITFIGVTMVLMAVVVVASYIPALRASSVPPSQALRGEQ
ncbi:MAG: ABC transporter permease [Vicinamibacterales bacterium]